MTAPARCYTRREIDAIGRVAAVLHAALAELVDGARAGATTTRLDQILRGCLERRGARPSFLGYLGHPAALRAGVGAELVMLPDQRPLPAGQPIHVDAGAELGGFHADIGVCFAVGEEGRVAHPLATRARAVLEAGIGRARAGATTGDVAFAIRHAAARDGLRLLGGFVAHGVGVTMHEGPLIHAGGDPGRGALLQPGMVLAIEPAVTPGSGRLLAADDGWGYRTLDGAPVARWGEMLVVTSDGAEILGR